MSANPPTRGVLRPSPRACQHAKDRDDGWRWARLARHSAKRVCRVARSKEIERKNESRSAPCPVPPSSQSPVPSQAGRGPGRSRRAPKRATNWNAGTTCNEQCPSPPHAAVLHVHAPNSTPPYPAPAALARGAPSATLPALPALPPFLAAPGRESPAVSQSARAPRNCVPRCRR